MELDNDNCIGEENNMNKNELIALRMELATRRNSYKFTCGLVHDLPPNMSRMDKNALMKIFLDLDGYSWSNNFGWVGQSKSITKHQIDPLEASPIYYDGLVIEVPEEDTRDSLGQVTEIIFTGIFAMRWIFD